MMKHSYEQVFELFMEKLSGNLSPEDEKYVEKMLAEDVSFCEVWHTLEEESRALKVDSFLEQVKDRHLNIGLFERGSTSHFLHVFTEFFFGHP